MKAIIQRVAQASVSVIEKEELSFISRNVSSIGKGFLILIGIHKNDTESDINELVPKILNMKLFSGSCESRWKRSIVEEEGEIILVSQFTLYAVTGKSKEISCKINNLEGRAPDFHSAMNSTEAKIMFEKLVSSFRKGYVADKISSTLNIFYRLYSWRIPIPYASKSC